MNRQRLLPFRERAERRERRFKRAIAAATLILVAAMLGVTRVGRSAITGLPARARVAATRLLGVPPSRGELSALVRVRREGAVGRTRESLARFFGDARPEMRRLFRAVGMDPAHALIGSGRAGDAFVLSSDVFGPGAGVGSYRLLPDRRSVWLRQVTLLGGPLGLFLVPDTPGVRSAAEAAGAVVEGSSVQRTNSWGLRGPEPEPGAVVRGVVLGDSYMQGMFLGDDETPPAQLGRALEASWKVRVSVLNTGHIGYAPEQYHAALVAFGDRFRPQFVVVSVCPNDFGRGDDVTAGRGDDWDEARYWLGEINRWCLGRRVPCVLVPVTCNTQVVGPRRDGRYPAPVSDLFEGSSQGYCDPADEFVDEHLRMVRGVPRRDPLSPLYLARINDGHFSAAGAAVWARVVARRVALLVTPPAPTP